MKKLFTLLLISLSMFIFVSCSSNSGIVSESSNISTESYDDINYDDDDIENAVYITPTGSCYHKYKCGNGNYFKVSLDEAEDRGLVPCSKCY